MADELTQAAGVDGGGYAVPTTPTGNPLVPVNVQAAGMDQTYGQVFGDVVFPGEDIERAVKASELRARRLSYRQIAQQLGYSNERSAQRAVQGALAWVGANTILESRELMLLHLDLLSQVCWRIMESHHLTVSNGRVVKYKGRPVEDDRPTLEAVDRLLAIEKERRIVLGLAAPKQHQHVVINHDSVNQAIAALEAELAANDPAD